MVALSPTCGTRMAKRIPRPHPAALLGFAVSESEALAIEKLAFEMRLTVAGCLRVLAVTALRNPDKDAWNAVLEDLMKGEKAPADAPPKRPVGRPPKKPKQT